MSNIFLKPTIEKMLLLRKCNVDTQNFNFLSLQSLKIRDLGTTLCLAFLHIILVLK